MHFAGLDNFSLLGEVETGKVTLLLSFVTLSSKQLLLHDFGTLI